MLPSEVNEFRMLLSEVADLGVADLGLLWESWPWQDPRTLTKLAKAQIPDLVTMYSEIASGLTVLLERYKPDLVSVEKLFFTHNQTTAMTVSQARGVLLLVAEQHAIPLIEFTPLQIKQALTGYGRAEKRQIQEMVKVILKLNEIPKPDDCADALAAAITHSMNNIR